MPNRQGKAGSFREHPDELVRRFGHEQVTDKPRDQRDREQRRGPETGDKDVHQMLFERAWRKPH